MKFSVKNLRSLSNNYVIDLKPITILVGRNSSGKSTFARAFPLMRQSLESKVKGNILWNGNLTDFGSYIDSVNRMAVSKNETIHLYFEDSIKLESLLYTFSHQLIDDLYHEASNGIPYKIDISYDFNSLERAMFINKIILDI